MPTISHTAHGERLDQPSFESHSALLDPNDLMICTMSRDQGRYAMVEDLGEANFFVLKLPDQVTPVAELVQELNGGVRVFDNIRLGSKSLIPTQENFSARRHMIQDRCSVVCVVVTDSSSSAIACGGHSATDILLDFGL